MFAITSRYFNIPPAEFETAEGKKIVPAPSAFTLLLEHSVTEGERLDSITAQYLGDPEQFWRVCDANGAIRPEELIETVGRRLRITLPEGIPGGV
jgi:hypothetical protein